MSKLPVPATPRVNPRWRAIRDVAVFQLKLFVGGLVSTVILSPLSFAAGALDLLSGSHDRRSFDAVLKLGKRLEQWVNLYGTLSEAGSSDADLDAHLRRLEEAARKRSAVG